MSALDNNPSTLNFLNPLNFKFFIKRAPSTNFFIQTAQLPAITLPVINVPTSFLPIPVEGSQLKYEDFTIEFKLDEAFQNYMEIYNWIVDLGSPTGFSQFAEIAANPIISGKGLTSDITLLVLDALQNPIYEFTMQDAFPINLSGMKFDSTPNAVNYVTASATFKYLKLSIHPYLSS